MRKHPLFWSALLAGAMLVGCGEDDTNKPMAPPAAKDASKTAADAAKDAGTAAKDSAAAAKEDAKAANDAMKDAANKTGDASKEATADAKAAATDAKNNAAASMTAADAESKLAEVMQYVKDNKYDLADKTLKGLEDNKASLPASVADKLPALRTQVNALKAGGGMAVPGMSK